MSKFTVLVMWPILFGDVDEAYDDEGRLMKRSACKNANSAYQPTIDHIKPLSKKGCDVVENIRICHRDTNFEKGDKWPHWKANGHRCHGVKIKGTSEGYRVVVED